MIRICAFTLSLILVGVFSTLLLHGCEKKNEPPAPGSLRLRGDSTEAPLPAAQESLARKKGGDCLQLEHDSEFCCPNGAQLVGSPPPEGIKVRCERNGLYHGPLVKWFDSGGVEWSGTYLNNEKRGRWVEWYENGEMRLEGAYHDGKKQGPWSYWYESGGKRLTCEYVSGVKHGPWMEWDESGQHTFQANYVEGLLEGTATRWYPNGNKKSEGSYNGGKIVGVEKRWLPNGRLPGLSADEIEDYLASRLYSHYSAKWNDEFDSAWAGRSGTGFAKAMESLAMLETEAFDRPGAVYKEVLDRHDNLAKELQGVTESLAEAIASSSWVSSDCKAFLASPTPQGSSKIFSHLSGREREAAGRLADDSVLATTATLQIAVVQAKREIQNARKKLRAYAEPIHLQCERANVETTMSSPYYGGFGRVMLEIAKFYDKHANCALSEIHLSQAMEQRRSLQDRLLHEFAKLPSGAQSSAMKFIESVQ